MTRLTDAFRNKKAFIPFVTAGDPDLSTTEALIYAMAKAGAGVIELGIPFSDPVAEGPVIQEADNRALAAGFRIDALFDLVERVRIRTEVPLVFLTYDNPIFTYGRDRFFARCAKAGIDGVIVPDVPFEERETLRPYAKGNGIALISLVAPSSHERVQMLAREAEGYIYLVSSMGVTGVRETITTNLPEIVKKIRQVSDRPIAVGFGIARPEQAAHMAAISDGAIVGSAIVKLVAKYGKDCVAPVRDYVRSMVEAVRG
ncbi:MAG: tryptophan synthase subunit alpha [Dialister sp.]|nr:tryptophan synthase subunit alpha [Dialister sp.]